MKFRSEILCLALAGAAAAFAPPAQCHRRSMRMEGGDRRLLTPRDFIASNYKKKSAFVQTETLRWEMRSTLTSDEEAKTTEEKEGADFPPFPEQLPNGIWDLKSPEQHA